MRTGLLITAAAVALALGCADVAHARTFYEVNALSRAAVKAACHDLTLEAFTGSGCAVPYDALFAGQHSVTCVVYVFRDLPPDDRARAVAALKARCGDAK